VLTLVSAQVRFFEDVVEHSLLIHIVIEAVISVEVDANELLAGRVGDLVLV
jgi:hypothetical protein